MANAPTSPHGPGRENPHDGFLAAVNIGDLERVRRYLNDPAINVNYVEPGSGLTALHVAAGRNAGAVVRLLVGTGKCDPQIRDALGRTAATVAVVVGRNPPLGRYLFDLQHGSGIAALRARRGGTVEETDLS